MFSKVLTTVVVACAVVMNGCKSNIKTAQCIQAFEYYLKFK